MLVPYQNLTQQLNQKVVPIYLVAGDETLLVNESCQAIKAHAKAHQFSEYCLIDKANSATELEYEFNSRSLFSTKKCIELRCDKPKLSNELKQVLIRYCEQPDQDYILLIRTPQLPSAETKQAWFKAIDKVGIIIQIWPLQHPQFPAWVKQRMLAAGINSNEQGYQIIAASAEGNLLAADQEIQKLALLHHGTGHITPAEIEKVLANNARYNVFELADAALAQKPQQCCKILASLKATAAEPAVILWALCQDLRKLVLLNNAPPQQFTTLCLQNQIWNNRQKLFKFALSQFELPLLYQLIQYAKQIDAMIKGIQPGNVWNALENLCLTYANPRLIQICQS